MTESETRRELYEAASPKSKDKFVDGLSQGELDEFPFDFRNFRHPGQKPPAGDWRIWLVMGGRGFGKTRAGAEWVRSVAEGDPFARIALVGTTLSEARSVMVEGESGLIACSHPDLRPRFEPSLHRLRWPNGAQAFLYSAAEPESLRGPQHSHACRSGSEGVLRERGACARGYAAPYCNSGRSERASIGTGKRTSVAGGG